MFLSLFLFGVRSNNKEIEVTHRNIFPQLHKGKGKFKGMQNYCGRILRRKLFARNIFAETDTLELIPKVSHSQSILHS